MKRTFAAISIFLFIAIASLPVLAESFSGMVIDATTYNLIVKNGEDVKIFQIRPETNGDRYPNPQDTVTVQYENDNGILIALNIKILKYYRPSS